ncbi:MAG TPA: hypothetical protein VII44_08865 [Puia sp.]
MKNALIAGLVFFGSCKSTETINRFAKSASSGTAEISRSTLSFSNICRLYDPAALAGYTDSTLYAKSVHPVIHCKEFKTADSLTDLISQTLVNYFSMLQAVSDKKLIAYNAQELVNSLADIQPQVYPPLSLNAEKISAVRGLLNSILNEPFKWYRYKKLVSTMQQNNSALGRVINAYSFILDSALAGEIRQAKENYNSFVYAPLYEWSRSTVEKVMVNQQYKQFLLSLDNEQKKIHKAILMLNLIQKDHYLLAYGKPPAGFAYTEGEISQDIILINKIITELIQLIK